MANFSFLACIEVAEKFVCGWVGGVAHMATMFNLNPSYLYIYIWILLFQNYCDKSRTKIIIYNNVVLLIFYDYSFHVALI